MEKERLDQLVLEKGLTNSREKAKGLILSGAVKVNRRIVDKPGTRVPVDSEIQITSHKDSFVSRGGFKLQKALDHFEINCKGMTAIDIGASTGGFTHCLLQHGAAKVFAVDVGYGQFDWGLRNDARVALLERKNARYLCPEDIEGHKADIAVIDVSFISIKKIIPPLKSLLDSRQGIVVALIKPQFEAGKDKVGKGGIIKDPATHKEVLAGLLEWLKRENWQLKGLIRSPIEGQKGNIEFLVFFTMPHGENKAEIAVDDLMDPLFG